MSKSLLFLISIMPLIAFSQPVSGKRKTGELIIHGTLSNIKEPVPYVYMICLDGNNGEIDSAGVIDNKYDFRVQTGVTTLITLFIRNPRLPESLKNEYMLTLVVEPATVTISSTDSFYHAEVAGSRAYREFSQLEQLRDPYTRKLSALYARSNQQSRGKEETELLEKQIDSTEAGLYDIYLDYIKKHPSSLVTAYALDKYIRRLGDNAPDEDVERVAALYKKLPVKDKNSFFGRHIKKKLDSYKISVGMTSPAFVQNDTLGNPVSLSSFKGKYVLLDFWASWCIPCRRENPNLVKVFNAYKDKGFTILSVSLDRPGEKDRWLRAIRQDGLNWTHVSDLQYQNNSVALRYRVNAIPQNFLIDPSGKIIAKGLHGRELEKKIRSLFD